MFEDFFFCSYSIFVIVKGIGSHELNTDAGTETNGNIKYKKR